MDTVEALLVLTTTFAMRRPELHRRLAGHAVRTPAIDLYLDGYTGRPSTRTRRGHAQRPLEVNERTIRRYARLGFDRTVQVTAREPSFAGARVRLVCEWLLSSRLDPNVGSAFIKTGTAAESLVAGNALRGLTERVSQRIALLVASNRTELVDLKDALKTLYGVRCDFAHGRHSGAPTRRQEQQLEAFDRLVTLGLSSFSQFCTALASPADVDAWFRNAAVPVPRPFTGVFARRALALARNSA